MRNSILILITALFITSCGDSNEKNEDSSNQDTLSVNSSDQIANNPAFDKKEELLSSLIGEHYLVSISANLGANTMDEYYLEDETWTAGGSANSGGERDGYDIDLSEDDLQKLKTAKIVVTEELEVYFSCDGETYFSSPFNATGMNYLLRGTPEDFIMGIPENLDPSTLFIDGYLFIYAKDQILESEISEIDIAGVYADAATIVYDEETATFSMDLFYGDCCDFSTYTFQ
jgi:hypothetical protein